MRDSLRFRRTLIAVGGILLATAIAFGWLGYFSNDPFTLVRPKGPMRRDVAAVLLSGDMGFQGGLGPQIVRRLAADGIPVVRVNSLSYFQTTRTPMEVTSLIERAMHHADAFGGRRKLILIGQSYGADMMHVGLAGLPKALRRDIAMVALIVPAATVEYRASPGEILTFAMSDADALPTARQLDWTPLLCVGGREEAASLCPLLHQANLHAVMLPGGHPLHGDSAAAYRQITAEMARAGLAHVRKA